MKTNYNKIKDMFKKKVNKTNYKKQESSYQKKADAIWSEVIKIRDGYRCVLCGKTENLNSHHIIHKSRGKAVRYEILNGVCLCAGCHNFKIHKGDFLANKRLVEIVGSERIEAIQKLLIGVYKPDYQKIIADLQEYKNNIK